MQEPQQDQRLITVAIHTYDRAIELKHLLEHQGVAVALQNVNLSTPVVSSGIRVRIKESDLPIALRIIENVDLFEKKSCDDVADSVKVLVPVDFAPHSLQVLKFAFNYAATIKAEIVLLHTYINPALSKRMQITDNFSFELSETQEEDRRLFIESKNRLDGIVRMIYDKIRDGEMPPVKFSTEIKEGVPEDVIVETSKSLNPKLIIMGTRRAIKKECDSIGSVTAEVLDSSRVPVLSIPETSVFPSVDGIANVVYLCNVDQNDLIGIDLLNSVFNGRSVNVILLPRPSKKGKDADDEQIRNLIVYCENKYSNFRFTYIPEPVKANATEYRKFIKNNNVNLIAIPNRKRNVFSRFFNPSVAHRILLKADAPLVVLPV